MTSRKKHLFCPLHQNRAKEFLQSAIEDYNACFHTSYSVVSKAFENYYKDLAKRVKGRDSDDRPLPYAERVDLLIVVGMFLTGFDAPDTIPCLSIKICAITA